jgi:hypothetical protein
MLFEVLRLPFRFHAGGYRMYDGPPAGEAP